MRCFDNFLEKKNVDIFGDVLQNAKHQANDASNDVNRPPLHVNGLVEPPSKVNSVPDIYPQIYRHVRMFMYNFFVIIYVHTKGSQARYVPCMTQI